MVHRKKVDEVFTPRSPTVNSDMYIPRKQLEKDLARSVRGSMHSFLFGESGNGKSWLFKKAFIDNGINFTVANCANASRNGSILNEIYSVAVGSGKSKKISYTESKKAEVSAVLAKGELNHSSQYELSQEDRLIEAFRSLNKKAGGDKSVIVLDNVETIFKSKDLMSELSDIIILLDDERYAQYKIKFLIVGVPNEVMQYFSAAKNPSSVGNRIEEIRRVSGLEFTQVRDLVRQGLTNQLKISINANDMKLIARHIFEITLGVPQRIHEYCECLAYIIEDDNWNYDPDQLGVSDNKWLIKGLRESYTAISSHLNSDETSDGRRNQVIYALGINTAHHIDTQKIGEIISREFPNTAPDSNSGIGRVLAHLSKGDVPILKAIDNSSSYVFSDPRHLMCIRVILVKNPATEKIRKKGFKLN